MTDRIAVSAATLLLETLQLRHDPDPVRLRDAWARVPLRGVAELAAFEGCTLWLYQRLQGRGVLDGLQRPFAHALSQAARRDAAQNLRVDSETEAIVRRFAAAGVPCTLLKGVARRAAVSLYPYSDARATSDVDILVPASDAERAWAGLRRAGYEPAPVTLSQCEADTRSHHLQPLIGPRRVAVEIHTSTSRRLPPEEAWRRSNREAQMLRWSGVEVRVPSSTELLWHSITHAAQEHEMYEHGFRLRYFQDAAVVLGAATVIDWDELARRLDTDEVEDAETAARWLGAAATLAGTALPATLRGVGTPFGLARSLRWRLGIFRRIARWPRLAGHLLAEEVRAALGQPATPAASGASLFVRSRHGTAAGAARAGYRIWRATQRQSPTAPGVTCQPALE